MRRDKEKMRLKRKIAKFLYYVEDIALEDIGILLGDVSKARVSQLIKREKRAKRKLAP